MTLSTQVSRYVPPYRSGIMTLTVGMEAPCWSAFTAVLSGTANTGRPMCRAAARSFSDAVPFAPPMRHRHGTAPAWFRQTPPGGGLCQSVRARLLLCRKSAASVSAPRHGRTSRSPENTLPGGYPLGHRQTHLVSGTVRDAACMAQDIVARIGQAGDPCAARDKVGQQVVSHAACPAGSGHAQQPAALHPVRRAGELVDPRCAEGVPEGFHPEQRVSL